MIKTGCTLKYQEPIVCQWWRLNRIPLKFPASLSPGRSREIANTPWPYCFRCAKLIWEPRLLFVAFTPRCWCLFHLIQERCLHASLSFHINVAALSLWLAYPVSLLTKIKHFFFYIKTLLQVFLPLLCISFLCGDSTNITRQQQPVDFWREWNNTEQTPKTLKTSHVQGS